MIQLVDLWKTYRLRGRETHVARGLNATFETGRSVALLGRNGGAGKSSLLRMIAGTMDPPIVAISCRPARSPGRSGFPAAFTRI